MALYRAKSSGRNRWALFDAALQEEATGRLRNETDLRRALQKGEFRVLFQPIVSLSTWRVVELRRCCTGSTRARADLGRIVPDAGRASGTDRAAGALGDRRSVPPARRLPGPVRRAGAAAVHQPVADRARQRDHRRRPGGHPATSEAPPRTISRSRSTRARRRASRTRASRRCTASGRWASASCWTTSGRARRRCPRCGASRSTRSRSTVRSSASLVGPARPGDPGIRDLTGQEPGHRGHRRGDRDRGPGERAAGARLRHGPGLLLCPTYDRHQAARAVSPCCWRRRPALGLAPTRHARRGRPGRLAADPEGVEALGLDLVGAAGRAPRGRRRAGCSSR